MAEAPHPSSSAGWKTATTVPDHAFRPSASTNNGCRPRHLQPASCYVDITDAHRGQLAVAQTPVCQHVDSGAQFPGGVGQGAHLVMG